MTLIVGIGGSTSLTSMTDRLLAAALGRAAARGAETVAFTGPALSCLPIYGADEVDAAVGIDELASTVARADGLIIATPGYHGGMSGMIKNGLDHLERLRDDPRPYLDGRAVGVIVAAAGLQSCGTTLVSVRTAVHALRGWPTPFGAAVNTSDPVFGADGSLLATIAEAVERVADQVVDFAERGRA